MRWIAAWSANVPATSRCALLGCVAAGVCLLAPAYSPAASTPTTHPTVKPPASVTLVQCVTAVEQAERSATFSGEMSATGGSSRMEMRIDVLERLPEELSFHTVTAPGLGVWRSSAPGVRVFKYLKQVTNLSAPASYKAAIRFRWLGSKGRLIKSEELRTPRCQQPAPAPTPGAPAGGPVSGGV